MNKEPTVNALRANGLHFDYDGIEALSGINLVVRKGEILGIIGPNGAGKSTLLKALAGVLKPKEGKIWIGETPLDELDRMELAKMIAWIPQSQRTDIPLKVYEVVALGRYPYKRSLLGLTHSDHVEIEKALRITNTLHLKDRLFQELSGGETQRVILARALAQEPEILLLDEPTNNLDLKHSVNFFKVLQNLAKKEGKTVIWVSHDLNLASRFSERLILIDEGKLVVSGTVEEVINEEVLQQVYGIGIRVLRPPLVSSPVVIPI